MSKINYIIYHDQDYIYIRLSHRATKHVNYINNGQSIAIHLCEKFYKIIKNLKYDMVMIIGSWPDCYFKEYKDYFYEIKSEYDSSDIVKYCYIQDSSGFCGELYRDYIRIKYDKKLLVKLKLIL